MPESATLVRGLVASLKELRTRTPDDAGMATAAPNLVRHLIRRKRHWLRDEMCVPGATPGAAGTFKLHEEPDHSLAIFVVTWLPGEETPPHDHGTWAVIGGLEGRETNHWWNRLDDGSVAGYAEVERAGSTRVEPGVVIAMGARRIHSVQNESGQVSVSLHVYGMNVDYARRCRFDPERRTTSPYPFGATLVASEAA